MKDTGTAVVLITAANDDEAGRLSALLVDKRLAACVNIVPGVRSLFHWEGKTEEATECLLIAKTRTSLVPRLIEAVKRAHSYQTPEIIALPVVSGSQDYLDWVNTELTR